MIDRKTRRGIRGWMLFDWANQPFQTLIVTFVFAPYFVSEVVGDPVRGQAVWGLAVALAGGATALLAPVLGAIADRMGARKPWVFAFSAPYLIGCAGIWLAVPDAVPLWPALVFFGIAFIGSELTLIFTNAMLPGLAPRSETGRISGSGWALGYVGGLAALATMLLLVVPVPGANTTLLGIAPILGLRPEYGEPARAAGPFCAIWFTVFALPMFLHTPDARPREPISRAVRSGIGDLFATLRDIRSEARLLRYLIASMIYRDGLAALFAFGAVFASGILGWEVFEVAVFGIIAAAIGALGAWLGGRADSAFGPRPVIIVSILVLILVCLIVLSITRTSVAFLAVGEASRVPDIAFYCAGALLGAASGAVQAASRTMLIDEAEGRIASAQAFGLYALSGRVTAFIGPALIAIVTAASGSQRVGISPVILLFVVGLLLIYSLGARPGQRMEGRSTW